MRPARPKDTGTHQFCWLGAPGTSRRRNRDAAQTAHVLTAGEQIAAVLSGKPATVVGRSRPGVRSMVS